MRHRSLAGEGVDEFDPKRPTYILVTPSRHVVGYACLLPATGPTMILVLFPISSGPGLLLPHAAMVETSAPIPRWKRGGQGGCCTPRDARYVCDDHRMVEWSTNGYREIVTGTDVRFERILKRAG
jgi:N-acyl-L-homoserine lactone synthetase